MYLNIYLDQILMSETDSETSLPSLTLDNPVSFEHGNESQEIPDSGSEENIFMHLLGIRAFVNYLISARFLG